MLTWLSLLMVGAVTANQIVKRQGRDGNIVAVPVAAEAILYEGTMCFEDAGGDFTGTVLENGQFGGIVRKKVDNTGGVDASGGSAAGKWAEVWTDGVFELNMDTTSLTAADIGKPVYGVDNYTVSETATDLVPVGVLVKIISTSKALVSIHGLGQRDTGPLVT
jgi:hypothetical protein